MKIVEIQGKGSVFANEGTANAVSSPITNAVETHGGEGSVSPKPWVRIDRCAIVRLPVVHSIRLIVRNHVLVLLPPARV